MNKTVLKTLEFNKITEQLSNYASCEEGKKMCLTLEPSSDFDEVLLRQNQTKAALDRIFTVGNLSFRGITNIIPYLKHLEIGGVLTSLELLQIARLLEVTNRCVKYHRNEKPQTSEDCLSEYFSSLMPSTPVALEINRCILSETEIADDASQGLKEIRKSINRTNDKIKSQLNNFLNHSTMRSYLQEAVVTMRAGRYCLPVKSEYKSKVPGMVHDQSSTGATFFIEPMSIVELNNHLKELSLKEKDEIDKVLASLSCMVAEISDAILTNYKTLVFLDFVFAKGYLAKEQNAVAPILNQDGIIHFRGARHPLLSAKTVVPIDLSLGENYQSLIVTGPNTGGKTVSLKTCGLLTLMGQAGLHIPTKDRSKLAIFYEVYADIGDEQSIEQSLSTFSSHMTKIVSILEKVSHCENPRKHLALFDELCAGTDPAEGAALATAILQKLQSLGVITMATTHYSELKLYALSTPKVENASLEFSVESLSPTYRLLIGVPGKSNAFAISQKLGISSEIIEDAKEHITKDQQSFEDLFLNLEEKRQEYEQLHFQLEQLQSEIQKREEALEKREERLESAKSGIIAQANEEARSILQDAKQIADETIRNFHKYGKAIPNIADMEKERATVGKALAKAQEKTALKPKEVPTHKVPKNLRIGDNVKVVSMNAKGTVVTLPNAKGDLMVQLGIMRASVKLKDLELIEEDQKTIKNKYSKRTQGSMSFGKAATISPECKLLGMTGDDAIMTLDKYLDDARLAHLKTVRIVHGKGTGVLRKVVAEYLRKQQKQHTITGYHLAEFGEGDAGVTIVEL